jgi:hypothetical protein
MFKLRLTKDGRFSGAICFFLFSLNCANGKLPELSSPIVDEV